MSCPWAGILLLALQVAASQEQLWLQQSPGEIWTTPGQAAELNCTVSYRRSSVYWYKESQDGSLQWVAETAKHGSAEGRYLSEVSSSGKMFSLVINKLQEEDSGVYYCTLDVSTHADFGNGTRLIVSDTPQPSLAILVPSPAEEAELPDPVPLLCLLSPHAGDWGAALWDAREESPGKADAGAQDRAGRWSLKKVPRQKWIAGTHSTCTAREEETGRNISTAVAKGMGSASRGPCWVTHWVGLPCVCLLLLIQGLILLSMKCPTKQGQQQHQGVTCAQGRAERWNMQL
ncbi:T-cell surface glycoprotein CD8 beta chain-like isoform X1 [Alligator mississippiensis]|uniref:T-cell surface glycoprotein CD8 beta chain-like isoform X1 n=1 Tax=Alligator mississippiensis TaxID=8496 RepID=UPI002877CD77|nr:T-cell surface glycoprotein CD8 beta chain-like isoform X1 [Alligator mississippiensis]XP_059574140.1 T-cell surface glycoprotein CD8 beta chain-like isoform X1 [Alligator mississippiensis]